MIEQIHFQGTSYTPSDFASYKESHPEAFLPPTPYVPTLEERKAWKKNEIAAAWRNDIEAVGMPVEGYDFAVDYDIEDALIWQNAIEFLDPTATEVEVRGIENGFHVIPRALFESIPAAQKAHYAQQLQKKWALQKAVDAAETVEELEAITWSMPASS